jgi:hypothetical protein
MGSPSNISQTNDQLLGRQGRDLAIAARGAMGRKSVALEGGKATKVSFFALILFKLLKPTNMRRSGQAKHPQSLFSGGTHRPSGPPPLSRGRCAACGWVGVRARELGISVGGVFKCAKPHKHTQGGGGVTQSYDRQTRAHSPAVSIPHSPAVSIPHCPSLINGPEQRQKTQQSVRRVWWRQAFASRATKSAGRAPRAQPPHRPPRTQKRHTGCVRAGTTAKHVHGCALKRCHTHRTWTCPPMHTHTHM